MFHKALHDPCQSHRVREIGNEARLFPLVLAGFDVVLHDSRARWQGFGEYSQAFGGQDYRELLSMSTE